MPTETVNCVSFIGNRCLVEPPLAFGPKRHTRVSALRRDVQRTFPVPFWKGIVAGYVHNFLRAHLTPTYLYPSTIS